jgi:transglutaminase-like putative cysteine protease
MNPTKILAPVVAALALSSGALAEEPTAQAAVRSFKFNYGFTIKDVPADAKSVKVWVPVPQSSPWQDVTLATVEVGGEGTQAPVERKLVTDPLYGNQFWLFDFSKATPDATGHYATVSYEVTRKALRPLEQKVASASPITQRYRLDGQQLQPRWLQPDALVPLDGKIAAEADATVTADAPTTIETARALYDHIVDSVKYDKSGPAGTWGRGDALYACDVRAGNCTDFHSLFIGQARSLGIPARFTIGFSVPNDKPAGDIGGYHCWAEFWDDQRGWLPIDASEAAKDKTRRDELFGGLDADRVDFAWGRDIKLPESAGAPVNFIIYPYVEVDGKPHTAFDKKFSYENL